MTITITYITPYSYDTIEEYNFMIDHLNASIFNAICRGGKYVNRQRRVEELIAERDSRFN